MKCILGTKVEMTRVFKDDGTAVPVTVVQAGPCVVTQVKKPLKSIQVGFGTAKHSTKALDGHLKGLPPVSIMRDFIVDEGQTLTRGDSWNVSVFTPGEKVTITGTSKGHGFQGVVKRHGFHGAPASHGHKDQLRMPGSIGSKRQGPVQKGKRMAGRMGNDQITVHNVEVVLVDEEKNILYLKGAIPGARGGVVEIKNPGTFLPVKNVLQTEIATPETKEENDASVTPEIITAE